MKIYLVNHFDEMSAFSSKGKILEYFGRYWPDKEHLRLNDNLVLYNHNSPLDPWDLRIQEVELDVFPDWL